VLTHLPGVLIFGTPDKLPRALLMGAGWVIKIVVAEWIIRKRLVHPTGNSLPPHMRLGFTNHLNSIDQSR